MLGSTPEGDLEETRHPSREAGEAARHPPLPAARPLTGYARYWPADGLAPFVEHLWTVEWDLPAPSTSEVLSHPSVQLVIETAARRGWAACTPASLPRHLEGKGRVLGVKFRPGGFRPLFGRAVSELTDRMIPVAEIFGGARRDWRNGRLPTRPRTRLRRDPGVPRARHPAARPDRRSPRLGRRTHRRRPRDHPCRAARSAHRPSAAQAAAAVRRMDRRAAEMGDSALPPARSGGADRARRGARLARPGARAGLRRPGALHPRLQETRRPVARRLREVALSGKAQRPSRSRPRRR